MAANTDPTTASRSSRCNVVAAFIRLLLRRDVNYRAPDGLALKMFTGRQPGLSGADQQVAPSEEAPMDFLQDALFGGQVEIDQDIAAEYHVERANRPHCRAQVERAEADHPP